MPPSTLFLPDRIRNEEGNWPAKPHGSKGRDFITLGTERPSSRMAQGRPWWWFPGRLVVFGLALPETRASEPEGRRLLLRFPVFATEEPRTPKTGVRATFAMPGWDVAGR